MATSTQNTNSEPSVDNTDSTLIAKGKPAGNRGRTNSGSPTVNITVHVANVKSWLHGGTSHSYRSMSSDGQNIHKDLKSKLTLAISNGNRAECKSLLLQLQTLYNTEASLTGDASAKEGLKAAAESCGEVAKVVTNPNFNLTRIRPDEITVQNSTDGTTNDSSSVASDNNSSQYSDMIATFSENGKDTGKITNLPKAIQELREAGSTSDQIETFVSTYFEKQGVPESQRAALVADATSKAGQPNTNVELASAGSGADRQR
jgi:hypothetical protein